MLNYLYSLRRRGIKVGLHRTKALLKQCGNPHKGLPVVHIAGTNGKGSTAAMIASVLKLSGLKVGLYTSPHLLRFNERIRVNGIPISDDRIIAFLTNYQKAIDSLGSTFFETTTAIMFSAFAEENVDVAVVEVGMGGRLDSSNVAESKTSVLTVIDFDHMEFLGNTLSAIATEKCGIFKEGVPVVTTTQQSEAMRVIEQSAAEKGCQPIVADELCPVTEIRQHSSGVMFNLDELEIDLPLVGEHQVVNAQTAIAACRTFAPDLSEEAITEGLRQTIWPGRLQRLSENPPVYFDVGHNPHGIESALKSLREIFPDAKMNGICAMKKSKDFDSISEVLQQQFDRIVTIQPDEGEFFAPEALAVMLKKRGIEAEAAKSQQEGIEESLSHSLELGFIFGSHYIAEAVFDVFDFPFDKGII
tara:strand:- start:69818 stop:71065 length:1248 start_codon:yes stop_codon:yes gene_type:complete